MQVDEILWCFTSSWRLAQSSGRCELPVPVHTHARCPGQSMPSHTPALSATTAWQRARACAQRTLSAPHRPRLILQISDISNCSAGASANCLSACAGRSVRCGCVRVHRSHLLRPDGTCRPPGSAAPFFFGACWFFFSFVSAEGMSERYHSCTIVRNAPETGHQDLCAPS